jgi:hypothetical protein
MKDLLSLLTKEAVWDDRRKAAQFAVDNFRIRFSVKLYLYDEMTKKPVVTVYILERITSRSAP